jgi:hypothetical protein
MVQIHPLHFDAGLKESGVGLDCKTEILVSIKRVPRRKEARIRGFDEIGG